MFYRYLMHLLLISGVSLSTANAFDTLSLDIEKAEYSGWQIENLAIELDIFAKTPQLSVSINKLKSATGESFSAIHIKCPIPSYQSALQFDLIQCESGNFSAKNKLLGQLKGNIDFVFNAEKETIDASISQLSIARGSADLDAALNKEKWKVHLKGRSLDVARLKKIAASLIEIPDISTDESGRINIDLTASGQAADIQSANINLRTIDLGFDGNSVAEDLDCRFNVSLTKKDAEWRVTEYLEFLDGAVYIEPGISIGDVTPGFLLEPGDKPITLSLNADWRGDRVNVHEMVLTHPQVMTASVRGVMHLEKDTPIENLMLSFNTDDLQAVFPIYAQPLLFGTGLDQLEIVGRTKLEVTLGQTGITDFHLVMNDVFAEDDAGRFHVAGLAGDVRLNSDPNVKDSGMKWQGGSIYKMNIGPSEMKLSSKGRSMRLREKMVIPIFDGTLQVDDLEMKKLGLKDYSIHIDSRLTPITLSEFTEAMGWPIMAGNVSGQIPGVTYQYGDLAVKGKLHVNVFDGDITIGQMKIDDLFGLVPTLYANIDVDNLDLGILTQTFEFGDITGKLSGYVHDLRLDNWQPVQFDASFSTPEDDRSRHRISQRAIDNLTSIGGGGGANAISRGIMGMFEDFPYSKIGLSCRLVDSVCFMDGVEQTNDGYYILKRGLLPPWLDIKGFNRKIDWQDMLERLKNISKTESPVVQ